MKVEGKEVGFMSRGKDLSRIFIAYDWNFYINV
jgi:hypothetical protein